MRAIKEWCATYGYEVSDGKIIDHYDRVRAHIDGSHITIGDRLSGEVKGIEYETSVMWLIVENDDGKFKVEGEMFQVMPL